MKRQRDEVIGRNERVKDKGGIQKTSYDCVTIILKTGVP